MLEMKKLVGVFTVACPSCDALLTVEGDGRCTCEQCGATFMHGFGYLLAVPGTDVADEDDASAHDAASAHGSEVAS